MTDKIIVDALYKIFGDNPERALSLLEDGLGKDEIFTRTGLTVGVENASFTVGEGEIFVLMGLSGSGKSTMIRMFNRLIEPTLGSIRIDGEELVGMSDANLIELRRRDVAMVFQSFALLPNRTVYENASFGLEVAGVPKAQRRDRTMEALDAVGLQAYAESLPSALSGGMRQRVGLARALATDPAILLMDEAFSALDPLIRTEMQDQLLELQRKHRRTVVFVSHDLDEALRIGDRIAIMQHGRVVQVATPGEILLRPANDYVSAFFRGVDVSQVFTIGQIAERAPELEVKSPEAAADEIRDRLVGKGLRLAVVLDDDSRLVGAVTTDSLSEAVERDDNARCADALVEDIEPIRKDELLADALEPLADSVDALPVIDQNGNYVGLASHSAMLRALHRGSDVGDGNRRTASSDGP